MSDSTENDSNYTESNSPERQDEDRLNRETLLGILLKKERELETAQQSQKQSEEQYNELILNCKKLLKDRGTFIKFLHLVFPSNVLEEKDMLIPPQGQDGYGMFDYNYLYETWTQMQLSRQYEQQSLQQEHQNEKTMLCDKIKELGREFSQMERSHDRSSMQNYWATEMEKSEEASPTLAQQFEFALAKQQIDVPELDQQFDFVFSKQNDDQMFFPDSPTNHTSGKVFEQFLAAEENSLSVKCEQQQEQIEGLEFKITAMTQDSQNVNKLIKELQEQAKEYENHIDDLERQLNEMLMKNGQLKEQIGEMRAENCELKQKQLMMDFQDHQQEQLVDSKLDDSELLHRKRRKTDIQVLRRLTYHAGAEKDIDNLKQRLFRDLI